MSESSVPPSQQNQALGFAPAGYDSDNSEDEMLMVMPDTSTSSGESGRCFDDERIKIVPHIGWRAGIGDRDFDIELDDNIATWFEGFRDNFKTFKKGPVISQRLQMFYMNTRNPYEWSLKLFANCPDHNSPKSNSLAYTVLEEMRNFKKHYNLGTDQLVDDNLRMVAFNFVAKQGHCLLFRMVVDTFEFLQCRELFVPKLREMIARKQYKEAGQIAIDLELFDEFDEHDFVMPLFMQDKISIAEDYLNKAERLQRPVVQLLDSFFDKRQSVESHCSRYITEHEVSDVYYSKLHQKPLSKLVQRLAKNYNVPKQFTPNVNKMKNFGALQFLVHKRYTEKSLNKDSWDEMVRDTVSETDRELQLELVCLCSNFNDQQEAAKWASHYKLKRTDLPLLVQDYILEQEGNQQLPRQDIDDEQWDAPESEPAHTLRLDESHVHLVDTKDKFLAMLSDLSRQSVVAFDSEWKPTFGGANEVSLIQLATWDDVYMIDVLVSQLEPSDWAALAKNVFNRDDILKLSFAPSTDISMFQKALPSFNVIYSSQNTSAILDLQLLWRHVERFDSFRFPYHEESVNQNLANLVRLCLGKKLDKSNQFSNWAKRPLRKEQLRYAALDAFCLLEIYEAIERQLTHIQLDPNEILNALLNDVRPNNDGGSTRRTGWSQDGSSSSSRRNHRDRHKKRLAHSSGDANSGNSSRNYQNHHLSHQNRPKAKGVGSREQQPFPGPNTKSVLVSEVRFVCDRMLEGLAKMLRRFGIDTVAIRNEKGDRCVFVAHQEGRYVLTRGANFHKYCEYLPPGNCYNVSNDRVEDQLLEVLRYYKIVVRQENIFSRCQLCNCGRFLSATPEDVYRLKTGTPMPANYMDMHRKDPLPSDDRRMKLDRSWILDSLGERHHKAGRTDAGVPIDIGYVSDSVIANVDVFYICDGCGRCYWDGSHLENILAGKLVDLLSLKYD
ncbi:exonuclease mut-7 homolog [Aedes albopictus]|uniref:3'-5' exonuclease domain-containing protein n=1 Tax=Aedes albopictus TaxID=7160 RepID=A0ABM1YSK3_AEDAL